MFISKTFDEVCRAMQNGALVSIDGREGLINGIQREDGSGRNWLVTLSLVGTEAKGGTEIIFWREGKAQ